MQDLTVTLIQTRLIWKDIQANLSRLETKIQSIDTNPDLIVLPEMFPTGFSMQAGQLFQEMDGPAVDWMIRQAQMTQADLTGSMIIREQGKYFNRLIWAKPDGSLRWYDKRHLFRYAGEEKVFTPGSRNIVVERNGWRIRPFICYDLRFPVWTRNLGNQYDLALFVANWPRKRAAHWNVLLQARAIENQSFVAAVNIVGKDGNGLVYAGDSCVIDPQGGYLFSRTDQETIFTATLSGQTVLKYRETFPAWKDADTDLIRFP